MAALPGPPERPSRGVEVPLPALVGAPLTAAVFVLAMVTHEGARYAGPAWLAVGLAVYAATRWRDRRGMLEDVDPRRMALPVGASFHRILVPMKLGDIGEEMVATAVALAKESGAQVEAITVVQVPRERSLDAELRRTSPSRPRRRSRRPARSARRTASTCAPMPSGHARSGTRSSTRRPVATPT